jgi:hypothetical protein
MALIRWIKYGWRFFADRFSGAGFWLFSGLAAVVTGTTDGVLWAALMPFIIALAYMIVGAILYACEPEDRIAALVSALLVGIGVLVVGPSSWNRITLRSKFEFPLTHFPNSERHEITAADIGKTFQIGENPSSWWLKVEIEQVDWSTIPPSLPLTIVQGMWGRIAVERGKFSFPLPLVQHCRGRFGVKARNGHRYVFEFYVIDERPMSLLISASTYVDDSPNKLARDCLNYLELEEPEPASESSS